MVLAPYGPHLGVTGIDVWDGAVVPSWHLKAERVSTMAGGEGYRWRPLATEVGTSAEIPTSVTSLHIFCLDGMVTSIREVFISLRSLTPHT